MTEVSGEVDFQVREHTVKMSRNTFPSLLTKFVITPFNLRCVSAELRYVQCYGGSPGISTGLIAELPGINSGLIPG